MDGEREIQKMIFQMAKQMVKGRQDITGSNCLKDVSGKVIVGEKDLRLMEGVHGKTCK